MDIVKRKFLGLKESRKSVKTGLTVLYHENQKKTANKASDKTSQLLPFHIFFTNARVLGLTSSFGM